MATIYILEDDLNIQEIEAYALKNSGYQTEGFDNAREFFKKVSERVPSLLLLDIMLPDADGLDVLRKLRSIPETKKLPIILVTAKPSEIDKVKGLFSLGQAGFMLLGAYTYGIFTIPVAARAQVYQYFDGGLIQFTLPVL